MRHEQPNDRPIHPECAALLDSAQYCTCESEWCGWDGTPAGLDRALLRLRRLEARRNPDGSLGRGADADEDYPVGKGCSVLDSKPCVEDTYGFWKESERLKTIKEFAQI